MASSPILKSIKVLEPGWQRRTFSSEVPWYPLNVRAFTSYNLRRQRPSVGIVYMRDICHNSRIIPKRALAELARALRYPLTSSLPVVIVTSQWDNLSTVDKKRGEEREMQLRKGLARFEMGRPTNIMRIERKPADQIAVVDYMLESLLG
jgi:hypothetical protein